MSYAVRRYLSPFFTAGRQGAHVDKIVIHHAATTDFDGIGRTFQSRGVSAHYGVGRNNNVDQYVDEGNIAYHAGNWPANTTSIGIEHVNLTGGPDWSIDPATFATSTELVRDIANRFGLLPLVPFKNLFPHDSFNATRCPAKLKARLQELADAVNAGHSAPAPAPAGGTQSIEQVARDVIAGKYGNNPARVDNLRRAGYDPAAVQAEVNAQLTGKSAAAKPSISIVAQQVIAGAYGVMPARKANLERAGYNYADVQAEVNRQLGVGGPRATTPAGGVFAVGSRVTVANPVDYSGKRLGVSGVYSVIEVRGDRIVIGRGGQVTAAVKNTNLRRA